jgi:hypothetical protein
MNCIRREVKERRRKRAGGGGGESINAYADCCTPLLTRPCIQYFLDTACPTYTSIIFVMYSWKLCMMYSKLD